jgi:integrase
MSRIKNRLTARTVETKKIPGYYSDGGNLYLRISKGLTKTWAFFYAKNSKRTELGLGSVGNMTLEQARKKASDIRIGLSNGIDPLTEKRRLEAEKNAQTAKFMTFQQCAEKYIDTHKSGWKNPKHIQQWQNTLSQYAYPFFGDLDVSAIDTGLVLRALEPIWTTKNETAGRVRGRVESVLDWANVRGHREGDNPARWKGHLDHLLAKPSKVQKTEHHPALPYGDMNIFINELHQHDCISSKCLEFTILTACRTGEAIGALWSEVDLTEKIWVIPGSRMKAEREHRIPLSTDAMTILTDMATYRSSDFVFSGSRKGLSNMAMLTLLKRMNRHDVTVHGFRSSFRDWAAEQTAYPNELLEMALAHTIKNQAEAAYRRGDLLEKRRRLMDDWARFCNTKKAQGDNVTPIRKAV